MAVYLDQLPFHPGGLYSISIEDDRFTTDKIWGTRNAGGVTVFSECCSETMTFAAAEKVHAALGRYIEHHVREWCAAAGIVGSDLDSAIQSWRRYPDSADGARVQAVIEANRA